MNEINQLDQELAELKDFIADLKADRAAQKEKEKRESWTKYTAISLVLIAVLTTLASMWAGKYSSRVLVNLNESTFLQAQVSDEWSYYQAKSIKQNLYEGLGELAAGGANSAEAAPMVASFKEKVAKYKADQKEISDKAHKLEQDRDAARKAATVANQHGAGMGNAIAIFQIAIALSSICLVTKKRPLWYLSLLLAVFATSLMIHVWMS
jgi:hypothetical protein